MNEIVYVLLPRGTVIDYPKLASDKISLISHSKHTTVLLLKVLPVYAKMWRFLHCLPRFCHGPVDLKNVMDTSDLLFPDRTLITFADQYFYPVTSRMSKRSGYFVFLGIWSNPSRPDSSAKTPLQNILLSSGKYH